MGRYTGVIMKMSGDYAFIMNAELKQRYERGVFASSRKFPDVWPQLQRGMQVVRPDAERAGPALRDDARAEAGRPLKAVQKLVQEHLSSDSVLVGVGLAGDIGHLGSPPPRCRVSQTLGFF